MMNSIIRTVFCIATFVVSSVSLAQEGQEVRTGSGTSLFAPLEVRVNPVFGLASMKLDFENSGGAKIEADQGFSGGALLEYGSGFFGFQTGLLYNQFGAAWAQPQSTEVMLEYIGVPLFAKLNLMGSAAQTIYLKAGLMPSFLIGAEVKTANFRLTSTDPFERTDVPAVVGVGGALPISPSTSLTLDVSYVRGLLNVVDSSNFEAKNDGFMFNGGLSVEL